MIPRAVRLYASLGSPWPRRRPVQALDLGQPEGAGFTSIARPSDHLKPSLHGQDSGCLYGQAAAECMPRNPM